jgi:hypothetical protein
MLPVGPEVFGRYNQYIESKGVAPLDEYGKVWEELNALLDQSVTRLAFDLVDGKRAVVVMNSANITRISEEATPTYHQNASHGVCKGGNFSVRSVGALTGLGQFGVSRNFFRDEAVSRPATGTDAGLASQGVRRFAGPIRCIVLFDGEEPRQDDQNQVLLLTEEWREKITAVSDFSVADGETNRYRFCPYVTESEEPGCNRCLVSCPSGAVPSSSPRPTGQYSPSLSGQTHRFWDGALQFDNNRCLEYRQQQAALYPGWMCGRCLSICAGQGAVQPEAIQRFETLKFPAATG